ncbi:MAG: hypothetical protein JNL60_08155, partial [Bacteroidia bacterium]|nr:hypothetical protein [Bacteroidia bacterium]
MPETQFLVYIFASVSESLAQKEPTRTAVSMLPMLLQHGRIFDLPIVIPNCRQLVLRDLIYKNKDQDLITQCRVIVNGIEVTYNRSVIHPKTYYINGEKDSEFIIDVEPEKDLR